MQSAPPAVTFKDRFFEGLILLVIGSSLLLAAIGMLMADDTPQGAFIRNFATILAMAGLGAVLVGLRWARRRVELSETGVFIVCPGASVAISMDAVASVRIRQELRSTASRRTPARILIVKDTDGRTGRVVMGTAEHATFAQDWVDLACEKLVARWRSQLDSGNIVKVSKHLELVGSALVRKRTRIELDKPFEVQEVPATTHGHALLTITAAGQRLVLEEDEENYPVLRRFLLGMLGRR